MVIDAERFNEHELDTGGIYAIPSHEAQTPYTVQISYSAKRNPLDEISEDIDDVCLAFEMDDPQLRIHTRTILNRLGSIEDVEVVEKRNFVEDAKAGYNCAKYVFCTVNGESEEDYHQFKFGDKATFLRERGYELVLDKPRQGDVIAYGETDNGTSHNQRGVEHWGIYLGNNMVISKLGAGDVVKHNVYTVPNAYGDLALFYRKIPRGNTSRRINS